MLRERGWDVRAVVQPGRDPTRLVALGAEPVVATLDDRQALSEACRDCDLVFHVAAALGPDGSPPEMFRVNVEGAGHVLEAAVDAGVRRFVYTSSVAVYGEQAPEGADEDTPQRPSGPYGESKAAAESLCFDRSARTGI